MRRPRVRSWLRPVAAGLVLAAAGAVVPPAAQAALPHDLATLPLPALTFRPTAGAEHDFGGSVDPDAPTRITGCDVNGDGYSDVVTSTARHVSHVPDARAQAAGRVYVIPGGRSLVSGVPDATTGTVWFPGRLTDQAVGHAVACIGDVNGDGIADLAVGQGSTSDADARVAVVLFGAVDFFTRGPRTLDQAGTAALPGLAILGGVSGVPAPIGDATGDGRPDVALLSSGGSPVRARIHVIPGGTPTGTVDLRTASVAREAYRFASDFSAGLEPAGDFDGDGRIDLVVAEPTWRGPTGNESERGRVLVLRGAGLAGNEPVETVAATAGANLLLVAEGRRASARAGLSVTALPGLGGGGRSAIAIGVPELGTNDPAADPGRVYVLFGTDVPADRVLADDLGAAGYIVVGHRNIGHPSFGTSVEALPDVTGDGLPELLISSPQYVNLALPAGASQNGVIHVVPGKTTTEGETVTPGTPAVARLLGTYASAKIGKTLGAVGDVDRDGQPDFAFASYANAPEDGGQKLTVVRTGPLPVVDPGPGPGPDPIPDPGPQAPVDLGPGTPAPAPGGPTPPADPPQTQPTVPSLTAAHRGKVARKSVSLTLGRSITTSPKRTFQVVLTRKGKTVATGTLKGTTLKLTVKGVKKRGRTTYPKLSGTYSLAPPTKHKGKKLPIAQRIAKTDVTVT